VTASRAAPPVFDLQSHSSQSDGELSPAGVVAAAAEAGVQLLALTDHDTVGGVGEALEAAMHHPIEVVPAIELSSVDESGDDLHILGYRIDHTSDDLQAILRVLRDDRALRIDGMAARLREHGFSLADEPLEERRLAGRPIGRPHLATAVLGNPANAAKLAEEGIDGMDALFAAYLVPGARAFVARTRPTSHDAIDIIHAAGGVAVWAHPFWDLDRDEEALRTVDRFADARIDGVEVFYATHTEAQTRLLHAHCTERGLLTTGSADFHGPGNARFNRFRAFETYGLEPDLGPIAGEG
jgi:predicted metal-dependent phosphoesterase TrpH